MKAIKCRLLAVVIMSLAGGSGLAQTISVQIQRSGTHLNFQLSGLTPGNQYLLSEAADLNPALIRYWPPVRGAGFGVTNATIFTATNVSGTWSIPLPAGAPQGFFRVWDYTQYNGPAPQITTPAEDSTVAGLVHFQATLTDIFQATQAELFIDEKSFGIITNGQNGWAVDTALLPNGSHAVNVQFLSQLPVVDDYGSNNLALWYSEAQLYNLSTSNFLAENVAPRAFTAEFGTVPFAFDTAAPAKVEIRVFDATGTNLVWNTSVTNETAGTCYPYWNLLDNDSHPVPLPDAVNRSVTYTVVVRASALNSSAAGKDDSNSADGADDWIERVMKTNIHRDAHAGRTAVFYNLFGALAPIGINENIENLLSETIGAVQLAHYVHPSDADGWDRGMNAVAMPRIFAVNSDFPYFYTILTNQMTGQFQYVCDAGEDRFGAGLQNTASYVFEGAEVAAAFGTQLNDNALVGDTYGHRVRMANIEGCHSATGELNRDFGSPNGMDRYPGTMSKSSFVGWAEYMVLNSTFLPSTVHAMQIKYWHNYWAAGGFDDGPGIQRANYECLLDIGASVDKQLARRVLGSKNMTWQKHD